MMVTGTRSVMRMLGSSGAEIPKALMTVKCSKKNRRSKKKAEAHHTKSDSTFIQPVRESHLQRPCDEEYSAPLPRDISFTPPGFCIAPCELENERISTRALLQGNLYHLLSQEVLVHTDTSHLLKVNAEIDDKVDAPLRRETLSKLWCLHSAFYDLSTSVFCKAVCLLDSFISRVKVKPKYAMCVSAACYYIASKFERCQDMMPTPDSLVTLSRCGGTATDLTRMVDIILSKLTPSNVTAIGACPSTPYEFLRSFITFHLWLSGVFDLNDLNSVSSPRLSRYRRQLEVALTSVEAASFRPSCLALALLSLHCLPPSSGTTSTFELDHEVHFSVQDLFGLAQLCSVPWPDVDACRVAIKNAVMTPVESSDIQEYPASRLLGSSPPLVWTLSRRTQRVMSTSQAPTLPTILETEEQADEVHSAFEKLTLPTFYPVQETRVSKQF